MHDAVMRTTLTIDDDVLETARYMAEVQKRPLGEVVSDLVRQALAPAHEAPQYRNGILLLPRRDGPPTTLEMIKQIDDETP